MGLAGGRSSIVGVGGASGAQCGFGGPVGGRLGGWERTEERGRTRAWRVLLEWRLEWAGPRGSAGEVLG